MSIAAFYSLYKAKAFAVGLALPCYAL